LILTQGYYFDDDGKRIDCTPEIKGVSTSPHMSDRISRLSCYLAVVCGVSLTKSSIKRWIDKIGTHLPTQDEMLQQLLILKPVAECHIDGLLSHGYRQLCDGGEG
jgi:hypothetical protein